MSPSREHRRWWRTAAVAVAVTVGLLLSGCGTGRGTVDETAGGRSRYVPGDGTVAFYPPEQRKPAPELAGELVTGGQFDPSTTDGKVVVVNFWSSWCPPCRAEVNELIEVYQASRSDGVAFLGVNVRDEREKAAAFEKAKGVPYPSLFDPPSRTALAFRDIPPSAIPVTVVIDRQGRVAALYLKAVLVEDLQPVVKRVAAEPKDD